MSGESFFSRILTAMGLKTSYESKHKTAYDLIAYKNLIPAPFKNKCGYVSEFGEWIIEPKYEDCGLFADNGLAPVEIDGKWGYIDKSGSYVIEPKFDWAIVMLSTYGIKKDLSPDFTRPNSSGFKTSPSLMATLEKK